MEDWEEDLETIRYEVEWVYQAILEARKDNEKAMRLLEKLEELQDRLGTALDTIEMLSHKLENPTDKHLITLSEEDVWEYAKNEGIEIPEEKREDVIYMVKKFLESYCYDGAYTVWDAVKDAIKTALEGE
jgi:hypothetical protein